MSETLKTLALLGIVVAGTITIGVLNMPKEEGPAQQPEATAQLQTEVQRQAEKQTEAPKQTEKQTEAPRQTETQKQTERATEAPKQPETQKPTEKPAEKPQYYFDESGIAVTKDFTITILDYKVVQPGEDLNPFGEKPILMFEYNITNTSDKDDVMPVYWTWVMTAVQDNNDNYVNTLDTSVYFEDPYLDTALSQIKPGGTVKGAIAYELSDLVTPVVLTAKTDILGNEIGSVAFPIA